jgi:hypothetical protein
MKNGMRLQNKVTTGLHPPHNPTSSGHPSPQAPPTATPSRTRAMKLLVCAGGGGDEQKEEQLSVSKKYLFCLSYNAENLRRFIKGIFHSCEEIRVSQSGN